MPTPNPSTSKSAPSGQSATLAGFIKMYVDEPDNWQPIEEAKAREQLSNYYNNVEQVLNEIKSGATVRTLWAFYRYQHGGAS